jgi:hypothetical protein
MFIKFIKFLKELYAEHKQSAHVAYTPIEGIVFPNTYKQVSLFATIPARPNGSLSGSQFGQSILNILATQQRDDLIVAQCLAGNLPSTMRQFTEITVNAKGNTLTYFVSPDVLCVGDDVDFLRVSLNGYSARQIVDAFGCMLPTRKMADQIWKHADLKMSPTGMGASTHMTNTQTLIDHQRVIERQRKGRPFNLIAGHKKDIIFHSQLLIHKNNICIYGFHQLNGQPIQGAQYLAHDIWYQDYSHSIRLVSRGALLNGKNVDLLELLNSQYSYLINDEPLAYNANFIYKKRL